MSIDLDALEALEKAATPGPWLLEQLYDGAIDWVVIGPTGSHVDWHYRKQDSEIIAAARNALPVLLRELRAARATIEAARRVYLSDAPGEGECRLAAKLNNMIAAYDAAAKGET